MTKKIVKTYLYHGLGFPIELNNVEMVLVDEEYLPRIDVRSVAEEAIRSLVLQNTRLTGNQIKFIRSYFSLSLREFSRIVNESHMAVKKWENFENNPTNMDLNIEATIRLFIFDKNYVKNQNDKIKFYEQYHAINKILSKQNLRNGSMGAQV